MEEEIKLLPLDVSVLSEDVIEILLYCDSSTGPSFIDEIAQKNTHRPKVLRYVLNHPSTSQQTKHFISQILHVPPPSKIQVKVTTDIEDETLREFRAQSLLQKIQSLKIGERMQLALRGSRDIRSILIRDPNKEIMLAVMDNPKISETEIELIARQKATSVEVLRAIAKKEEWLKTYSIVHALITNPKTPPGIGLKHIYNLRLKDMSLLSKNRNVSEVIRATAKKLVKARKHK